MDINKIFIEYNRVFCYGIGQWGRLLTKYCKEKNLEITAYIVSESENNIDEFYGKKIYSIKEVELGDRDAIIIATSNNGYQRQIYYNIMQKTICKSVYFIAEDVAFCKYFFRKYLQQVKKRQKEHIFSYNVLAQPIVPNPIGTWNLDNIYYGQAACIKKHIKFPRYNIQNCTIDHAARFAKDYKILEITPPDGHLYAMSSFIWKEFENISIHEVGPFIRLVKSMVPLKSLRRYRRKMGKTLLVFPAHTGAVDSAEYEMEKFIEKIEQIKNQYRYDTVLVCCFCSEIIKGDHKLYREHGYKVVSAGYPTDFNFLRRLKTFILLATTMITNDVGTHLGYSIALNCPSYIINMDIKRENHIETSIKLGYVTDWNAIEETYDRRIFEIKQYFANYTEEISRCQYEIVKKYWGPWKFYSRQVK